MRIKNNGKNKKFHEKYMHYPSYCDVCKNSVTEKLYNEEEAN